MDFGDKVRHMREIRNLSTTELAKLSDLSQSFISDIENKRRTSPTKKTIEKLAKGLGVSPSYFMKEDIVTPFEVLNEIPEELRKFMLDLDNVPFLKLNKRAKENGITPDMIDNLLDTLISAMESRKKSQ